jgi:hypothetical protein
MRYENMMNFEEYPIQKKNGTIQLDAEGNKFQIIKGNFEYFVDIEKGVVAALMKDPLREASKIAEKTFNMMINVGFYPDFNYKIFEKYLSKPIRAKATCAEEDEFDLEIGMRIARERCLAKYYKKLTNAFVDLNNKIDPILSYIEDSCLFYADKYQKYSN